MDYKTRVDNRGRIPIPVAIKKTFSISNGDTIVFRVINNELKLFPMSHIVDELQNVFSKYKKDNTDMVDDFINMKRDEAKLENNK